MVFFTQERVQRSSKDVTSQENRKIILESLGSKNQEGFNIASNTEEGNSFIPFLPLTLTFTYSFT